MVNPTEVVGIAGAMLGLTVCVVLLGVYWFFLWRKREPKSPDYKAVGDFKPSEVFSWDSSASITKSLQEEHHNVQPKSTYGKSLLNYKHLYGDEASLSSTTSSSTRSSTLSSLKDIGSIRDGGSIRSKSSRCRTLSEMSESSSASQDSATFDTASIGIKPELYTRKDTVLRQESSFASLGRLHLRLKYDFRTSDLIVHLIEAQDLNSCDPASTFADPFVKLQLEPPLDNKVRQSSIKRLARHPVFDEYFKFPVGFEELRDKVLTLMVFDFDKYSHSELVGEVKVDFCTTDVSTTVEVWCDVEPASENIDKGGELLISLSYLPTAERLTIVIMKARNLRQPRAASKIDPVARITLLVEGKPIKRKKTSVHKSAINPVWNEAFVFNVPPHILDSTSLDISISDRDLLGPGGGLGTCLIGSGRPGLEGQHWAEMKNNVRKAVAKWQPLHV